MDQVNRQHGIDGGREWPRMLKHVERNRRSNIGKRRRREARGDLRAPRGIGLGGLPVEDRQGGRKVRDLRYAAGRVA